MPLYHFELVSSKIVVDEGAAELAGDIEAMDSADLMGRRLLNDMPNLKNRHYSILVTKEGGDEICRLPLDVIHQR